MLQLLGHPGPVSFPPASFQILRFLPSTAPLHFAAANGHLNIVELLLSCGARPDLTEKRGLSKSEEVPSSLSDMCTAPEDIALEAGHTEVARILRNWDRSVAASALPIVDLHGKRRSLDGRRLPPPDLRMTDSSPDLRNSNTHPSSAQKRPADLQGSHKFQSSTSLHSSHSETPLTFSSLTHLPNASSQSLGDSKRTGLPAVLEKAAQSGARVKEALRIPSSPSSSSLNRPPPLNLSESNQDAFSKPVLRRKGSTSSAKSALKGLFGRQRQSSSASQSPFSSADGFGLTPATPGSPSNTNKPLPRRPGSVGEQEDSPYDSPLFPSDDSQSPLSSPLLEVHPAPPTPYRPRKSSILSTSGAITADELEASSSRTSPSFGQNSQMTSPNLVDTPSLLQADGTPEEQSEATDQFPEMDSHFRSASGSRLRANSAESGSSNGSRLSSGKLSPHVVTNSPIGSTSGVFEIRTRGHRSASTSTDPDLRHLVLNSQHGSQTDLHSPASPSSSTFSQIGLPYNLSTASTPATSVHYSSGSYRDRKISSEDVTPSMADALVKQAEKSLFNYNSDHSSRKRSLSEQLAAYSDTLSLQREVNQRTQTARQAYVWEKLERDGGRTPIEMQEPKSSSQSKEKHKKEPFQQGVLDVRRDPPVKLRQEAKSEFCHPLQLHKTNEFKALREQKSQSSLGSASRNAETSRPPVSHQRTPSSALQYRILESNHLNTPGRTSPSVSSIDDPVRNVSSSTCLFFWFERHRNAENWSTTAQKDSS